MAGRFSTERLLEPLYRPVSQPETLVEFLEQLNLGTCSHTGVVLKVAAGLNMTAAALVADIEVRMQTAATRKKRATPPTTQRPRR